MFTVKRAAIRPAESFPTLTEAANLHQKDGEKRDSSIQQHAFLASSPGSVIYWLLLSTIISSYYIKMNQDNKICSSL